MHKILKTTIRIDRNRITYLILILFTILLGLLSRTPLTPEFIYPYLGDYLYALMFFFIFGFIYARASSLKVAILSILFCYVVELSQLYEAEWLDAIRHTRLGGLVLGFGFLWSDIISYTLAGVTGYVLETLYYRVC